MKVSEKVVYLGLKTQITSKRFASLRWKMNIGEKKNCREGPRCSFGGRHHQWLSRGMTWTLDCLGTFVSPWKANSLSHCKTGIRLCHEALTQSHRDHRLMCDPINWHPLRPSWCDHQPQALLWKRQRWPSGTPSPCAHFPPSPALTSSTPLSP